MYKYLYTILYNCFLFNAFFAPEYGLNIDSSELNDVVRDTSLYRSGIEIGNFLFIYCKISDNVYPLDISMLYVVITSLSNCTSCVAV